MAIAACSFVDPGRAFTVLRTDLIHLQSALARDPPFAGVLSTGFGSSSFGVGFCTPSGGLFVKVIGGGGGGESGGGGGTRPLIYFLVRRILRWRLWRRRVRPPMITCPLGARSLNLSGIGFCTPSGTLSVNSGGSPRSASVAGAFLGGFMLGRDSSTIVRSLFTADICSIDVKNISTQRINKWVAVFSNSLHTALKMPTSLEILTLPSGRSCTSVTRTLPWRQCVSTLQVRRRSANASLLLSTAMLTSCTAPTSR